MCDWFANRPKLPKQAPPQGSLLSQPARKIFIRANKPGNRVLLVSGARAIARRGDPWAS
jgi:hypothetical protein